MRAALLALALLAAAPATASAALGEVEPLTLRGDTECVGPTGMPGEVVVPVKDGVQLVHASRDGLRRGTTVGLGTSFVDCAHVVSRPNGAGVIAGRTGDGPGIVIAVREPGGTWGAPVTIPTEARWTPEDVAAAVSDRGDVLVTWREDRSRATSASTYRFRAVRRAPGAAFGAVEAIGTPDPRNETIVPAIAGTGEAFVLTTRVDGERAPFRVPVSVSSAAPGGPFGAPVLVATMPWLSDAALVAGPDGRALAVVPDGTSVIVAERPPGAPFGPAVPVGPMKSSSWAITSASLGPAGEAAVAWVSLFNGGSGFVTRAAGGSFGAPQALPSQSLVPANYDPIFASQAFLSTLLGPGALTRSGGQLGMTALTGDQRALFAWFADEPTASVPTLIAAPLAGGPSTTQAAGRGLVSPSAFPLVLPDGTPGLASVEPRDSSSVTSSTAYTLRVAAEGVAQRPSPAAPRVTVGAPRSRVLREDQPLRLPVRCAGPCEVRGAVTAGAADVSGTLRLARAGRGTLVIGGAAIGLAAPRGRVSVTLSYRAPGGAEAKVRTIRVALRRPAGAADTRVRRLRAVRSGDEIRVTWTIAGRPGDDAGFVVSGSTTRDRAEEPTELKIVEGDKNQRSFAITLRRSEGAQWVAVRSSESLVTGRPTFVRVR